MGFGVGVGLVRRRRRMIRWVVGLMWGLGY
jgi:hypothetical protein